MVRPRRSERIAEHKGNQADPSLAVQVKIVHFGVGDEWWVTFEHRHDDEPGQAARRNGESDMH